MGEDREMVLSRERPSRLVCRVVGRDAMKRRMNLQAREPRPVSRSVEGGQTSRRVLGMKNT
jgi:hypothetical protein